MDNIPRESRLLVYKLCCIWGLAVGSWTVLQITTPLLLIDIVGKEVAPTWQGVFFATTAMSGMFFCGIAGYLSDGMGRVKFITLWMLCFFVLTIFVVFSDITRSIYLLWMSRFGAITIPYTVIHAFLSDHLRGDALLESFSYMGATFGASVLLSSVFSGLIGQYHSRVASLIFGSCLSVLAVVLTLTMNLSSALIFRPSTAECRSETATLFRVGDVAGSNLRLIQKDPLLRNFIFALSLLRVGHVNTHMLLVLFANFRLGWGQMEVSVMLGVTAFLSVLFQLIGVRLIILMDIVLPALFVLLAIDPFLAAGYAMAMTGPQLYVVSVLCSMTSIASTTFNAKITALASERNAAGLVLGCVGTVQSLLEVVASLFLGRLMSWSFTNFSRSHVMSGLPFFVNGLGLTLVVGIVLYSHVRYGVGRVTWESRV